MKLTLKLTAAFLVFAGAIALILTADPQTLPDRGTIVSASATGSGTWASAEAAYIERITREPSDADTYVDLAQLYLAQSRRTADEIRYVPMARAQLERALELDADHYRARVLRGTLLNKLHQFEQAEDLARELIAEHPGHAYNYGTLVDALVELGRYEEAIEAADQMLARRPDLSSYSRASYIRELMGDADGAIRAMELAAEAGAIGSEGRSWAIYQLAELAIGEEDFQAAERLLNGLVEEAPGYAHALAGFARLRLVEGQISEAGRFIMEAMALAPGAGFEELAAEIHLAAGDAAAADKATDAVLDGLNEASAMGENVRMELADLFADTDQRLDEALWLASLEVARRPDHLHANETYAWVLHKLGRSEHAVEYIDRARRFDNGDGKATFRAGHIYLGAGRIDQGYALLQQSLDEGLYLESPSAAAEAGELLAGR